MACRHANTRNVYEQRPPSEGRKMIAVGRKCDNCGALISPGVVGVSAAHPKEAIE